MTEVTKTGTNEKDLAEKCRIALEKSFGMQVPMPICIGKKHHRFRF